MAMGLFFSFAVECMCLDKSQIYRNHIDITNDISCLPFDEEKQILWWMDLVCTQTRF